MKKARILFKDPWFYVQIYDYQMSACPYDHGYYEWMFITEGFFSRKRKFPTYRIAREYIEYYKNGNPDYLLIEEIER
jgi:hypothetical protein